MRKMEIIRRACIYCDRSAAEVAFSKREHVIPKLMGSFDNSPTLIGWVCDDCNGKVFSRLETAFKEDTQEGIFYQMFNLDDNYQIRIRGKHLKASFKPHFGDDFFKEVFPILGIKNGEPKAFFRPQIKIKRYGDEGYIVLLLDRLKRLGKSSGRFLKLKKALAGVKSKDVVIFAGANFEGDDRNLNEAIELLKELGIDYKQGTGRFAPIDNTNKEKHFGVDIQGTIERNAGRVLAKVAFNYFAFCAIKSKRPHVLYDPKFSRIKSYILGTSDLPIREVITSFDNTPFIHDERVANKRIIGHEVMFYPENGNLMGRVVFFGLQNYTILLGSLPEELRLPTLGSGHLFDPLDKRIYGLTQNAAKAGSGIEAGFGLFNRI